MPIPVKCSSCGHSGRVGDNLAGKLLKCPKCGQTFRVGSQSGPATPGLPVPLAVPTPEDEDAGGAYGLDGGGPASGHTCPGCGAEMAPQAVVCTSCGLDTRTGKKFEREPTAPARPYREPRRERSSSSSSDEGGMGNIVWFVLIFGVGNAILYYFTGWLIIPIRR